MVAPAAKRQAVAHLVEGHGMSERRACRVIDCCRMTMRYEVVRQDDPVLRERLKELAKARRRFGYRRLHVSVSYTHLDVYKRQVVFCTGAGEPDRAQGVISRQGFDDRR